MALAYACDSCNSHWPQNNAYKTCPRCNVMCRTAVTASVMTAGEAKSQINHITFLRECRLRDEKRERLGQPQPEEIGRAEAAELAKKWREITLGLTDE